MGEKLDGLGPDDDTTTTMFEDDATTNNDNDRTNEVFDERVQTYYMAGSGFNDLPGADPPLRQIGLPTPTANYMVCPDMDQLDTYVDLMPKSAGHVDIVELFGGAGGVMKVLIHRGHLTGQNFDLVCGWGLDEDAPPSSILCLCVQTQTTIDRNGASVYRVLHPYPLLWPSLCKS